VTIDWDELIGEVRAARAKMSQKNEHRQVLWKCEVALTSVRQALSERSRMEAPHAVNSSRSV
jgi:hypothetical protein